MKIISFFLRITNPLWVYMLLDTPYGPWTTSLMAGWIGYGNTHILNIARHMQSWTERI